MATDFYEEYQKALGKRGMALASKRTALQMAADANARREDLEEILFGTGQNYGIVSVLSILYNQIWMGIGKNTTKPSLYDPAVAKAQYQSDFSLSVTPPGDGTGGLHPPQPDNPDAGQDDTDLNSSWLTDHALEVNPSGVGVVQNISSLMAGIGVVASANTDGRGPYDSQAEATAQALLDRGSGMLGLRTENSEIYSTGTIAPQWWIGQNGIDTPDNFTTESSLISNLFAVESGLEGLAAIFQQELDLLNGDQGAILQKFGVDLPDDLDNLNNLISQFNEFIVQIQNYIDYFEQFSNPSPSGNRAEINTKLAEIVNYLPTISGTLNERADSIPILTGDASYGLNKHLVFWTDAIVAKPDGPYAMILAAQDMLVQADITLQKKNDCLSFFTTDYTRWIEIPLINSIYNRAVIDFDQATVLRWEADVIWNLIMSANKYKVLSRPLSQIENLDNSPWDESTGEWIVDVLPTTFLCNMLTQAPPLETFFFRVIAYDTIQGPSGGFDRMDGFNTQSAQTDIVSDFIDFTQLSNTEADQSVIHVSVEAGLRERDFLWVDSKIAQIVAVTDDKYVLDTSYGVISSIQKLFGIYFVASSTSSAE
jgi:hypothetical protein